MPAVVVVLAGFSDASVSVCVSVHALKGKRLELSIPKSTELQFMEGHALTLRSVSQRSMLEGYQMQTVCI